MEPVLWFVGILVLMIVITAIRNMINPPRDLEWADVPSQVREAVEGCFTDFEVSAVRYIPVARKYKMRGQYRGRGVELEVEGNADGSIREIELEDLKHGQMTNSSPIRYEDLPEAVTQHLQILIGPDLASLETTRLTMGQFNGETAYKIKGLTGNAGWEVEIVENGQLIEVEMSPRA